MAAVKWLLILLGLLLILGGGLLGLCGIAFGGGHGDPTAALGGILLIGGIVLVVAMASRGSKSPAAGKGGPPDGGTKP